MAERFGKALSAEIIRPVCDCLGHVWRERVLDPVTTIQVFLLQILHGNTACTALSRLAGEPFTATAYCEARKRLPLDVFAMLLQRVCDALIPETQETGRWHGHRTWTMDGSSFSMSDTPALQARFGQPPAQAKGCGFPVAHMLALFHAGTGFLMHVLASPLRTHDMRHAATMHPGMEEGDILVADRGFASFAHLAANDRSSRPTNPCIDVIFFQIKCPRMGCSPLDFWDLARPARTTPPHNYDNLANIPDFTFNWVIPRVFRRTAGRGY